MPDSRAPLSDIDQLTALIREELERADPKAVIPPPAAPDSARRSICRMTDLERRYGNEFIEDAFRAILKRDVDEDGRKHYSELIERGWPRAAMVARLRFSREGRAQSTRVVGLVPRFAAYLVFRVPVVGYLLAVVLAFLNAPRRIRQQHWFEHYAVGQVVEVQRELAAFRAQQTEALRAALNESRAAVNNTWNAIDALKGHIEHTARRIDSLGPGHTQHLSELHQNLAALRSEMEHLHAQFAQAFNSQLNRD